MIVSKSFIVNGDTRHKNGVKYRNLADNVDTAINEFLAENPKAKLIDVKHNVTLNGTQDSDFVNILLEVDKGVKVKSVEEIEAEKAEEAKKRELEEQDNPGTGAGESRDASAGDNIDQQGKAHPDKPSKGKGAKSRKGHKKAE